MLAAIRREVHAVMRLGSIAEVIPKTFHIQNLLSHMKMIAATPHAHDTRGHVMWYQLLEVLGAIGVTARATMIGGRDKDMIGTEQIIAEEMSTGDPQMKSILLIMEEKGLNMNILQVEHQVDLIGTMEGGNGRTPPVEKIGTVILCLGDISILHHLQCC